MANAVFNSLENYFSGNKLRPRLDWAKFDMSNIRSMDCDMGILYPFYLEDCLPGDKIKLRNTVKVQALPLKNPVFNNFKLYTYYYYVPYYLLWHKFDRFIEGGRDGTYTAELPYVETTSDGVSPTMADASSPDTPDPAHQYNTIWGHNTLWDYMGFEPIVYNSNNNTPKVKVSAFPFAAYQRIWRDYFLNQDVQTNSNVNPWYPEDDFDWQLDEGANYIMGQKRNSTTAATTIKNGKVYGDIKAQAELIGEQQPFLLALRSRNWNKDYFTSMWFSPQRGPTQAVPIGATSTLDFSAAVAENGISTTTGDVGNVRVGGTGSNILNLLTGGSDTTTAYQTNLTSALNKGKVTTSGGFTLADLHLAQQIEIWMERNMSVKAQYNEFLRIHFDDAPLDERLTKPAYIGGTVQDIQISEVLQTSQTTDNSAQGTATGHATSYENGYVGKYHSHEYGLVMGICCIMPEAYYNTGIDRHWTKTSRYDFYFPEFADLEPQAVLGKEFKAYTSYDDDPIGYIGRHDEYRHHRNLAVGAFRNERQTDFTSWVITRDYPYDSIPIGLNQELVSTNLRKSQWSSPSYEVQGAEQEYAKMYTSMIKHDMWETGKTVNPFIVQIGIGCEMVRPLPYVNDPTKQGR